MSDFVVVVLAAINIADKFGDLGHIELEFAVVVIAVVVIAVGFLAVGSEE